MKLPPAKNWTEVIEPSLSEAEAVIVIAAPAEMVTPLAGDVMEIAGGAEMAMHLTGLYPEWWTGLRFTKPVRAWFAGNSAITTRDVPQRMLFGNPSQIGTGFIPKHAIETTTKARGVPHMIESAQIKHVSGGFSHLGARSYDQSEDKWQGDTIDIGWLDEEPRAEIWSEFQPRLNAGNDGKGGYAMLTATPLKGMSEVIRNFYPQRPHLRPSLPEPSAGARWPIARRTCRRRP